MRPAPRPNDPAPRPPAPPTPLLPEAAPAPDEPAVAARHGRHLAVLTADGHVELCPHARAAAKADPGGWEVGVPDDPCGYCVEGVRRRAARITRAGHHMVDLGGTLADPSDDLAVVDALLPGRAWADAVPDGPYVVARLASCGTGRRHLRATRQLPTTSPTERVNAHGPLCGTRRGDGPGDGPLCRSCERITAALCARAATVAERSANTADRRRDLVAAGLLPDAAARLTRAEADQVRLALRRAAAVDVDGHVVAATTDPLTVAAALA